MEPIERVRIRVTDDRLEAWASIAEGPSADPDGDGNGNPEGALRQALEQASIRAGLDEEAIAGLGRALTQPVATLHERVIARGRPPEPGIPPHLQLAEPSGLQPGGLRPDGSLDFRDRQLLLPVARGECIGEILPATPGKPGWDVHGDPIEPTPPGDGSIQTGEGISIDEAGRLVATRSGTRMITPDGTVDVVAYHVHAGHVDLKSGHLITAGSLEVKRDVMPGMRVEAEFDLEIRGTVDGACIRAGGSVEIGGGAIGRESGKVQAGGDLRVRHALGICLEARGRLSVTRSVSTSQLVAREIEIGGRMLSDWLQAESRVVLKDVGSPAGGPCLLRAACPLEPLGPAPPSGGATALRSSRPEAQRPRGALRDRKGRGITSGRRATPTGAKTRADDEIETRRAWRRRQRELQRIATIEIHGTAHAGCRIDLGVTPLVLETDVSRRRFRVDLEHARIIEEEL
jgi:uncharacterized protein (DUF342 family)